MSRKAWKITSISLGIPLCIGAVIFCLINVIDKITAPSRITNIAQDYSINKTFFTKEKLIDVREGWSFNGDGQIEGTYRLADSEVRQLLEAQLLVRCRVASSCTIEMDELTNDRYRCAVINEQTKTTITLCVDAEKNEAYWRLFIY